MTDETSRAKASSEGGQEQEPSPQATQQIVDMGSTVVKNRHGTVHCLTIVGQVEGHMVLPNNTKSTKYEHVLPLLASLEESDEVDGLVLLLNTVLTVREGQPNSHKGMGWEQFTDRIIQLLNERQQPMVFLLWGGNARSKARLITNPAHLVLQCAHPSPLSAYNGFFGCRHFSKTNEFLVSRGMKPIDWKLD